MTFKIVLHDDEVIYQILPGQGGSECACNFNGAIPVVMSIKKI